MSKTVIARPDEPLDVLVRRALGTERQGNVEAVLAANPGLSAQSLFLPAGLSVTIPDVTPQSTQPKTTLW